MLKFIEKLLSEFRSCFTRTRTYEWFLVIISSLLIRSDSLGVTSFIRALSLDRHLYEPMLHFFQSAAFKTSALKLCSIRHFYIFMIKTYLPFTMRHSLLPRDTVFVSCSVLSVMEVLMHSQLAHGMQTVLS